MNRTIIKLIHLERTISNKSNFTCTLCFFGAGYTRDKQISSDIYLLVTASLTYTKTEVCALKWVKILYFHLLLSFYIELACDILLFVTLAIYVGKTTDPTNPLFC